MKIKYQKLTTTKKNMYLVFVAGSWKDLRNCTSWLTKNIGQEGYFGGYLIRYVDSKGATQPAKDFWKSFRRRKELEIRFNNEEDAMAFKLALEE